MLPAQLDTEIRRLLDAGTPQRHVAERLGVCRATVQAIARGRRQHGGRINEKLRFPNLAASPDVLPERCGGCGGMVFKPCVLCRARRHRIAGKSQKRKNKFQANPKSTIRNSQ